VNLAAASLSPPPPALQGSLQQGQLLRLNDPRLPVVQTLDAALPFCLLDEALGVFQLPSPWQLAGARVLVATCTTAGGWPPGGEGGGTCARPALAV